MRGVEENSLRPLAWTTGRMGSSSTDATGEEIFGEKKGNPVTDVLNLRWLVDTK